MRHPPRFTPTLQTPALPGFVVSGDAKNARFESFVVSAELHSILSMSRASDPSVLKTTDRPDGESVQGSTSFERVQIAASVERQKCYRRALHLPQRGRSFERVQMDSAIEQPPSVVGEGITSPPASTPIERVQLAASCSDGSGSNRRTQRAFERVQTPHPSGQPPDTPSAAPPFERVQISGRWARFQITPRPGPPRRLPRMTSAQKNPLRSTTTPKEETPMTPPQ